MKSFKTALLLSLITLLLGCSPQNKETSTTHMSSYNTENEQIQLCVWWPNQGLELDTARLSSIEGFEWLALKKSILKKTKKFPLLSQILNTNFPIKIPPSQIRTLESECKAVAVVLSSESPEQSALDMLHMHLLQTLDQRKAGISIEIWPGERIETHQFIMPDTDLLDDLIKINKLKSKQ